MQFIKNLLKKRSERNSNFINIEFKKVRGHILPRIMIDSDKFIPNNTNNSYSNEEKAIYCMNEMRNYGQPADFRNDEFIKNNRIEINNDPSEFDSTGQLYTISQKVFEIPSLPYNELKKVLTDEYKYSGNWKITGDTGADVREYPSRIIRSIDFKSYKNTHRMSFIFFVYKQSGEKYFFTLVVKIYNK